MPPKAKFSKEEIVEAALNIARQNGIEAVTAREVGAVLHSSARPIFTYFESMEGLKIEVKEQAKQIYESYIKRGLTREIPFLGVGLEYLQFAKDEPELYKLLFLTRIEGEEEWGALSALNHTTDLVSESIQKIYGMTETEARNFNRDLWLVGHSFATMIVTGACQYKEKEMMQIMTEICVSVCKAYKEIPGLAIGEYDKNKVFRELLEGNVEEK